MVRSKRLLDCPAVGTGALLQAAAVTLPAAAAPAAREHLGMDEVLITTVLRQTLSQHDRIRGRTQV